MAGKIKRKASKRKPTSDAVEILHRRMEGDPELQRLAADARINAEVAQIIYDARSNAGLTQKQVADLVGTTQPVIARLEDADYEGHSLTMLQRIAAALNQRISISFAPIGKRTAA